MTTKGPLDESFMSFHMHIIKESMIVIHSNVHKSKATYNGFMLSRPDFYKTLFHGVNYEIVPKNASSEIKYLHYFTN